MSNKLFLLKNFGKASYCGRMLFCMGWNMDKEYAFILLSLIYFGYVFTGIFYAILGWLNL